MTDILPEPIQSIIVQYVIHNIEEMICEDIDFHTLKWYDHILRIPKELYFGDFYSDRIVKSAYIAEWIIDKYKLSNIQCENLYLEMCRVQNLNGIKMLKCKLNMTKEDCLGKNGIFYYDVHYNDCDKIRRWMEEEFELTEDEIDILRKPY